MCYYLQHTCFIITNDADIFTDAVLLFKSSQFTYAGGFLQQVSVLLVGAD